MGSGYLITYKGKTQPLSSWCKELDLPYDRTVNRLLHGCTDPERLFSPERLPCHVPKLEYEYNGKWYSAKELSDMSGMPVEKVMKLLHSGWSAYRVMEHPHSMIGERNLYPEFTMDGETHTLYYWAKTKGLWAQTVRNRYNRGIRDPEKLFSKKRVNE